MIRSLRLTTWKSFAEALLPLEALTVLVGLNAAGKSNALDALAFLQRTANGVDLLHALESGRGEPMEAPMRGQLAAKRFKLEVVVRDARDAEYTYSLAVEVTAREGRAADALVQAESLRGPGKTPDAVDLFRVDGMTVSAASARTKLYNTRKGTIRELRRSHALLAQLDGQLTVTEHPELRAGIDAVLGALRSVFLLDPQPAQMRAYSRHAQEMQADGSNVAGFLAGLPAAHRSEVEEELAKALRSIAEPDIRSVSVDSTRFGDAMLYCKEAFAGTDQDVDARSMSDGSLRMLAILTAMLTRPKGSLLVVEEIDNGLHPSRARQLVHLLLSLVMKRGVDVLLTTHNETLLSALPQDLVPTVVVAHRDPKNGTSRLTVLEELDGLRRMIGMAPLGALLANNRIAETIQEFARENPLDLATALHENAE